VDRPFIVTSGLPGSGKTTLGRRLTAETGSVVLDKDDILEPVLDIPGRPRRYGAAAST
jgi:adenylate kinase family enzyme